MNINPDGSTTFEGSTMPPAEDAGTTDGMFEEEVKSQVSGTDPAIYLLLVVVILGALYYYYRSKSKQEDDDFFSKLDGEKVGIKSVFSCVCVCTFACHYISGLLSRKMEMKWNASQLCQFPQFVTSLLGTFLYT